MLVLSSLGSAHIPPRATAWSDSELFLMLMRAVGHASPEIHRRGGDIRVVFWSLEAESVCMYTEEWLLSQPCTPLFLISL